MIYLTIYLIIGLLTGILCRFDKANEPTRILLLAFGASVLCWPYFVYLLLKDDEV